MLTAVTEVSPQALTHKDGEHDVDDALVQAHLEGFDEGGQPDDAQHAVRLDEAEDLQPSMVSGELG